MPSEDEIQQLAMFTAALDARRFGAEYDPGQFRPTWEDRGPAGQEAYIADARTQFEAVETIQSTRRYSGQSEADAADAELTDPLLKRISEARAAYGDVEARLVAVEATITAAQDWVDDPTDHVHENRVIDLDRLREMLRRSPSTVLADHDKEVAARAVEAFAADLLQWYPEDVFPKPTDENYHALHVALARSNITLDRFSADLMRRAAGIAVKYATDLRSGSDGETR